MFSFVFVSLFFILLLYIISDVNYFLRVFFTYLFSTYCQKKVNAIEEIISYGICLPNDLNIFLTHMNNARYFRELDIALINFYIRTGILNEIMQKKKNIVQSGSTIRFRKPIPLFKTFKILTKIATWDKNSLYMEQKIITANNIICTISYSKQTVIDYNVNEFMCQLLHKNHVPAVPDELRFWIQHLELTSKALKTQ